ncbi:MAG TPA: hypothetical protein VMO26_15335 [Vicinamibacterales bacterium]|nr:hypothetical protein [Vicinamibacterales bacterium]
MRNPSYENSVGSSLWALGVSCIWGQLDRQFRRLSRTTNTTLTKDWDYTIIDNTGAAGPVTLTRPAAPARPAGIRVIVRVTVAQTLNILPAMNEQIMVVTTGHVSVSSNKIGAPTQLENILENIASGQWMVFENQGFV